jgi:DnaJ-class molecular chaperone
MTEPDVLDATIDCPDCYGSGEVTYGLPGFSCDLEQSEVTEDCPACHGSGKCRLGDLPKAQEAM